MVLRMKTRRNAFALAVALLAPLGGAGAADRAPVPALPSGLTASVQEVLIDEKPDGQFDYVRFRFVAPGLKEAHGEDFEARAADLDFLCNAYALPQLLAGDLAYDKIVISLADRETEFGIPDPEATQFFEVYHVDDGLCIWEEF